MQTVCYVKKYYADNVLRAIRDHSNSVFRAKRDGADIVLRANREHADSGLHVNADKIVLRAKRDTVRTTNVHCANI